MNKVAVAMSGGVDSSVAAALMVEKYGKENVFGITMKLFCYVEGETPEKSCCSIDAINDAKNVCNQLGIAHYIVNFEKEFENEVINNFVSEYEEGYTPNPCIRCNQFIKFEHLQKKAQELGAEILVTGHYARIFSDYSSSEQSESRSSSSRPRSNNIYRLLKGKDIFKDQSYFLYTLTQEQLAHTEFPIGEYEKTETRQVAEKFQLRTAQKTESQDICFVPSSVEEFLGKRAAFTPGNIVDSKGDIIGEHRGLAFYTIGQRRGLGGGFTDVMYVTGINKEKNEVIIGPEKELFSDNLIVDKPHWIAGEPKMPVTCTAKIRYQAKEAECVVSRHSELDSESILVTFSDLQKAITPGQSIVFYNGKEVLGGGIIKSY